MMKLFDIMNDMKNMSKQQIEQYQKNGYENNLKVLTESKENFTLSTIIQDIVVDLRETFH